VAERVKGRTEEGRIRRGDEASRRSTEITDSEKGDNSNNWRPKRVTMVKHVAPKKRGFIRTSKAIELSP
jgi:hypothetical protein